MKKADIVPACTLIRQSVTILKGKLVEALLFLKMQTSSWMVNQKSELKDRCILTYFVNLKHKCMFIR